MVPDIEGLLSHAITQLLSKPLYKCSAAAIHERNQNSPRYMSCKKATKVNFTCRHKRDRCYTDEQNNNIQQYKLS